MTRRSRWVGGAALIVIALGASWWWFRPQPLMPPTPPDIEDNEVLELIRQAQQPVRATPASAAAWGHLGKVLLAQQFDREADICFAEAFRLDPSDARWLYPRCVIILKRDPDHAVALLRQAAAVAGDNTPPDYRSVIHLQLAEALLERGQLDDADQIFRAERSRDPDNLRPVLGIGLIAQLRGENALAREMLTAAQACPSARRYATVQLAALARAGRQGSRRRLREGDRHAAPRRRLARSVHGRNRRLAGRPARLRAGREAPGTGAPLWRSSRAIPEADRKAPDGAKLRRRRHEPRPASRL